MIALIDYGIGNLRSVEKALAAAGAPVRLTSDPQEVLAAEKVVLPGVGAFGDGMRGLERGVLAAVVREVARRGTPLLGICLGMQLLFEASEEAPGVLGLDLLPGEARRFADPQLKTPHTGWNQLDFGHRSPVSGGEESGPPTPGSGYPGASLLDGLAPGCYAYFNHSYYCIPSHPADCLATTEYGVRYASAIGHGNIFGVQFHPEKSQAVGLRILENFVKHA